MGERIAAAAFALGALVAAGFCVAGLARDADVLGDGMSVVGWVAIVAVTAVVAAAWWSRAGSGTSNARTVVTTHIHAGGEVSTARNHEGGHGAMTEHLGGTVVEMRVNANGSGYCRSTFPRKLTARERAALAYAGGLAAGESLSGGPCSSDRANARAAIAAEHPWGERGAVHRAAREDARRVVGHGLLFPRSAVTRLADQVRGPR